MRRSVAPAEDKDREIAMELDKQLLKLVSNWIRSVREAEDSRMEADIDHAVFETFPASDPISPAAASDERVARVEAIDCVIDGSTLTLSPAAQGDAVHGGRPHAYVIEGDLPEGGRLNLRVWVEATPQEEAVPAALNVPAEHASIHAMGEDRRDGAQRRQASRDLPGGFDRRSGQDRRVATT